MRREWLIARRDLHAMMKEKSFVLVLLFEVLLVSSSAFLAAGYSVLTTPESSDLLRGSRNVIYVGLVTDSKREFALPLQRAGIAYYNYLSLSAAEKDFQDGYLDAIIIGSVDLRNEPSVITVYLPSNTPKIGLIRLALKRFFLDVEERLRGVKILVHTPDLKLLRYEDTGEAAATQRFEVFMIFTIPILFFMPAIMAGSLIIDSLTEEMESGRIINLLAAPLRYDTIVLGKCLGSFAATLPHCLIWLLALSLTDYRPQNPPAMLVAFTLYTTLFILLGAVISVVLRKNRASQMAYTLIAVAAIALMSPSANVSPTLVNASPAHVFTSLALGAGIAEFGWQILALIAVNAAAFHVLMKQSSNLKNPQ